MSDSLYKTLEMTIADILYGSPGSVPIVLIHYSSYEELKKFIGPSKYEFLRPTTIQGDLVWILKDGHKIQFIRSYDMPKNKVYIVEDGHYHTITSKTQDGTEKDTLSGPGRDSQTQ